MKLYDFHLAPNPKRVRIFLAEKGIEVPKVEINTREAGQFSPEFLKVNPGATIPALELDDGTCISETVAICRYFEEVQPEPPLMGVDAKDKAVVEMWSRRCELEGFMAIGEAVRNGLPMFEDRGLAGMRSGVPQIPALVERGKATATRFCKKLDAQLADNEFIAGPRFTIADITAFVMFGFASRIEFAMPEDCTNIKRWFDAVAARPSADA